jgi:HEAT repeat protein
MNAPASTSPAASSTNPAAWDSAIAALEGYHQGSPRAQLLPLDEAVQGCLGDAQAREALEQRLLRVLSGNAPAAAKDYVCRKLAWIASARSVPVLARLLEHPELADAARRALTAVPEPEAVNALRDRLPELRSTYKVGVIQSLGERRAVRAVSALAGLLRESDPLAAGAAAQALGEIAGPKAARTLEQFLRPAPACLRPLVADACLTCAERLLLEGDRRAARALYEALSGADLPAGVRAAAKLGLARVAR